MKPVHFSVLPIDVGFDLRLQRIRVSLPAGSQIHALYQSKNGRNRAIIGSRFKVASALRKAGYLVTEARAPLPEGRGE